ncbi:MAG: apolipoprotein N-acyltransferase [Pseudomonadota bacterium]|nr:apolipoprotein N-acyltransferase [Pseudomonadota bacterium]
MERDRPVWAERALALVAGAAAAFAQPPWGFLPGLLGYGLMLWLIDRSAGVHPLRSAFCRGWLTGLGYFVISVWWIAEPFQIDAKEQGWMAPFAVIGVSAFMALFWGAAALAYRALAGRSVARVLVFAAALSLAEWLRGHILTGFPWDLPGETWAAGSALSQAAALVGAYGLTWITLAAFSTPAIARQGWRGLGAMLLAALAVAGLYGFGAARLARAPRGRSTGPWVRVVQADVKQENKYDPRLFADIVGRYVRLTARPSARLPDIVVWPEGAIPAELHDYLAPGAWTAHDIAAALSPSQTLILGGYRQADDAAGRPAIYNSLAVVRRVRTNLVVTGVYDKFRLVPFGEFMPLDGLAARLGIKQLVHVSDGFAPGPRPRPMRLAGLPTVQPLICYEALYSGFTREGERLSGLRAAWIVNISNDAWFGMASGPRQHLNMARYRAIEEGLPMIRATPTGISAFIDAFGRIVPGEGLGEGAFGVIDAPLPPALASTLFDRWGDGAFWLMLIVSLTGTRWRGLARKADG